VERYQDAGAVALENASVNEGDFINRVAEKLRAALAPEPFRAASRGDAERHRISLRCSAPASCAPPKRRTKRIANEWRKGSSHESVRRNLASLRIGDGYRAPLERDARSNWLHEPPGIDVAAGSPAAIRPT